MKKTDLLKSSLIAALIIVALNCQTAVEPTNIIPQDGFRATVLVKDQGNNPVDGARVQWIITKRGATQQEIDAAFNAANGNQSAISGSAGNEGLAEFQIPVPIAQENTLVIFKTTAPASPQFLGIQKNGNFRVDTLTVCGNTFLEIVLQRRENVQCNQSPNCQDLTVTIEPPVTTRDTVAQGDFVQTDGAVTISAVTGFPASFSGVNISTSVFSTAGTGTVSGIPVTIAQGVPYRVRFDVDAINSSTAIDTTFLVTITATRAGAPCWTCTFNLHVIVKLQLNCDCPKKGLRFSVGPDSVCVGSTKGDTLKNVNLSNNNTDCGLLVRLNKQLLTEVISEVFVTSMNSTAGDEILLSPGSTLNTVSISFEPQTARNYNQLFVFELYRQTTNGLQKCDSTLTITFRGLGGTPLFAIDSASSTIFTRKNNVYVPDTLKQCTLHRDPNTGFGSICFQNPGTCPLDIDLSIINGNPMFSIDSGSIVVPPKKKVCVTVNFKPQNTDVYPNSRCNPPTLRDFNGSLRATSNFGSANIPLIGFADLDISCAGKAIMVAPKFGAKDNNNITYFITLDINKDNTISNGEQVNGLTDSVKIFVKDITTVGNFTNDANITGAVLSTGQFITVKFYFKTNFPSLPSDICQLFDTYRCPDPTNALTDQPVKEGDLLLFEYKGSYGIMWIKKLAWSEHTANALPQVEAWVCYPFN